MICANRSIVLSLMTVALWTPAADAVVGATPGDFAAGCTVPELRTETGVCTAVFTIHWKARRPSGISNVLVGGPRRT